MRFGTGNVRKSVKVRFTHNSNQGINKEYVRLIGCTGVRWKKGGTVREGSCIVFYGRGNENHQLGTVFLYTTYTKFVSDRMSCTVLRGRWCNIFVLIAHTPSQEKSDDSKGSFCEELKQVFVPFPDYNAKLHLEDFNEKLGREDIFKTTIGNESLYQDINDSGVRMVTLAQKKNLVVMSIMFPHRNIHKYLCMSAKGMTHNQTDHILTDRR